MSSIKGDGSSHRMGKEVAANDPPTKTMGEEAPYSKLDHSEEEEEEEGGGRDLGSECPPLINPWYNIFIHFPIVLGDYLLLPLGRMWLSICHYDTEVSWAPLVSTIPDLDIHQGTSLPVPMLFEFGSSTSLG